MTAVTADYLLKAGTMYSRVQPPTHTSALALHGRFVLAAGDTGELDGLIGPDTRVVNLEGRTVLPGLTDAHIHLQQYAQNFAKVDCSTEDLAACLERIRARAEELPAGSWIQGHGWDQNRWGQWPDAQSLDRVAPQHPVYLTARSLHAGAANSAALRAAGIEPDANDPPGGSFQRDDAGQLTGILFEDAMKLVTEAIPAPTDSQLAEMIDQAQQRLWRLGLTGIHDFDGRACFSALHQLHRQARLGLRTLKHLQVRYLDHAVGLGLRSGFGDDMLHLGNVKIFADGALGPRTAAMMEPYEDEPDNQGMLLLDQEEILEISLKAVRGGWPMTIHAIGDRANHHALNALESLRRIGDQEGLPWSTRHRIEHVQLLTPEDVGRLAELGVVASMQPIHATSDREMAIAGWGERTQLAYAWRSVMDTGPRLVFGSDAPVESPAPFWGLHAAVNRTAPDGQEPADAWIPQQRVGLQDALAAYTQAPANITGRSHPSGQLTEGSLADLIVLERDPFQIDPRSLKDLKPVGTMVDGVWRFREF